LSVAIRSPAEYLRLYFLIEGQYIKARLHYRADFMISSVGMLFSSLATLGVFAVLFSTIDELAGWSFMEMVFIYAFYMVAISPMQILFDQFWFLRFDVREGTFLKYYFRPLNMMFYYVSERFDLKGLTQLVLGVGLLVYSSLRLGLGWTPGRLAILFVTLLSASLVQISLVVMAACSAFWFIDSWPVLSLAWKMREFAPYPMTIFSGLMRITFTYILPIGFVAFFPSQLFLRPETVSGVVWAAPFVGIGLFAVTYLVWSRGVDAYTGTGS
jgi:ABC-2 type transport system permease protein